MAKIYICESCHRPNCDGVIFKCIKCSQETGHDHIVGCKNTIASEFKRYNREVKPGRHLEIRGYGEIWDCGPLIEIKCAILSRAEPKKKDSWIPNHRFIVPPNMGGL
jgi:hypothetical protein